MSVLTVALTGGIATGKSVVARVLGARGCYVHHADATAHELMKPGRPAWKKIVCHFGPAVLRPDQSIDRSRLGKIIFADARERDFLNRLLHPLVRGRITRLVRGLEREGSRLIFVSEAALTLEAGYGRFYDRVIVVYCPEEIQVKRLRERDRLSRAEALRRVRSQMPGAEKIRHADYLIDTSGSVAKTVVQAERVYRKLLGDLRKKQGAALRRSKG